MAGYDLGGLSDLTKKQADMAFARNPLNNNDMNLDSMEGKNRQRQGVLSQGQAQAEQQQQRGVSTGQGATGRTAGVSTPFQGMGANLGSFNDRISAAVNQFLQGGASDLSAEMVGGFSPEYVGDTWQAGMGDQTMKIGASGLAGEKSQELGGIRDELSPLMLDGRFKNFEEVVEQFGDTNRDGIIDAQEQENINRAFGIVNQIRRLRTSASGPEREALLMQLQQQDSDGLVTGIMEAMDTYDQVTGMTVSGAGGREFGIGDILEMGTEDLASEIENAAFGRDSLFGGTMAADVKNRVDTSASRYRAAGREQARVMNQIKNVADEWISGYEDQLEERRGQINEQFLESVQGVVQDLDNIAAEQGNPEWVQRAKQWFIDTSRGSREEGTDFASVLMNMVTGEAGLQPEIRKMFEQYLDQTLGGAPGQASLARMLTSLGEKGYLEMPNDRGAMIRVPLTMNDKLYISQVISDSNLTTEEKQAKVQSKIEEKTGVFGQNLAANASTIAELIDSGELEQSTELFRQSLVNSLRTYQDSFVDDMYGLATSAGAAGENVAGAMQDQVNNYQTEIATQAETAAKVLDKKQADATRDIEELNGLIQATEQGLAKGTEVLKSNYVAAIQNSTPQYRDAIRQYMTAAGIPSNEETLTKYSEIYAYLRVMDQLRRHGGGPAGNIYNQVLSYFDGLPAGGKFFSGLVDKPSGIFALGGVQLEALRGSMALPRFEQAFRETEQFNSLNDLYGRLTENLGAANTAITDINNVRNDIASLVTRANADIAKFAEANATAIFDAAKQGESIDMGDRSGVTAGDIDAAQGSITWIEDPHGQGDIPDVSGVGPTYSPDEDRVGIDELIRAAPEAERQTRTLVAGDLHKAAAAEVAADFTSRTGRETIAEYDPDQRRYIVTEVATGRKVSVNPNPYIDMVTSADDVRNVRNYQHMLQSKDMKNSWHSLMNTLRTWAGMDRLPGPLESAYTDKIHGEAKRLLDEGKLEETFRSGASYLSPQQMSAAIQALNQPSSSRKSPSRPSSSQTGTAASPTGASRKQTGPRQGPSQFISGETM